MISKPTRRALLQTAAAGAPALLANTGPAVAVDGGPVPPPNSIPIADLPRYYDVTPGVHNLEAGYWSVMPRPVAEIFAKHTARVNRDNAVFARNMLPGDDTLNHYGRAAKTAIAGQLGCSADEIAVTRSGSEALQMLIVNYKPLKAGDSVICCDLDYDSTICAMEWLGSHKGAQVVKFAMPEPATTANILAAYDDVLKRTPRAKLLLLTQVSNRTGLITPVKEIVAMARARGVDTIVDIAHGVACLDFKIGDLGCDFAGWSVHKWTSAPLGTGAIYIRKNRLADIDIAYGNSHIPPDQIDARVPAGVINFAALMTIPAAVHFQQAIGTANKERHLRSLRDRWVHAVRDLDVDITVPDDPARYCAITSFRLKGMMTKDSALAVQHRLFEKYRILTIWREGPAKGPVIRVTPGLYSTTSDVDALAAALRQERGMLL